MSEETRDMLLEQLKGTRAHLDEIWAAMDSAGLIENAPAWEALDALPLEIVWEKGEPFAVVLGTGGPLTSRSEAAPVTTVAPISGESITRTGEYFRELVEETDQ